jgi:hypothetical protein
MNPQPFGFFGQQKPRVGDFYQGGIIVYVDYGVGRGLIADTQLTTDNVYFGPNGTFTQNAAYGFGYSNTQNIINELSPTNGAAFTAWNLTRNGYSDWFLPNLAEANYLYQSRSFLTFWTCCTLWCSEWLVGSPAAAYTLDYDGTISIKTRSETDNRESIACRYMDFN